jgi:hypothetical protein
MNEFSSTRLISQIQAVMLETFEVKEREASDIATRLAALAEGWGGSDMDQIDWIDIIAKRFGNTLRWRSEAQRVEFESRRDNVIRSYEQYVRQNTRP